MLSKGVHVGKNSSLIDDSNLNLEFKNATLKPVPDRVRDDKNKEKINKNKLDDTNDNGGKLPPSRQQLEQIFHFLVPIGKKLNIEPSGLIHLTLDQIIEKLNQAKTEELQSARQLIGKVINKELLLSPDINSDQNKEIMAAYVKLEIDENETKHLVVDDFRELFEACSDCQRVYKEVSESLDKNNEEEELLSKLYNEMAHSISPNTVARHLNVWNDMMNSSTKSAFLSMDKKNSISHEMGESIVNEHRRAIFAAQAHELDLIKCKANVFFGGVVAQPEIEYMIREDFKTGMVNALKEAISLSNKNLGTNNTYENILDRVHSIVFGKLPKIPKKYPELYKNYNHEEIESISDLYYSTPGFGWSPYYRDDIFNNVDNKKFSPRMKFIHKALVFYSLMRKLLFLEMEYNMEQTNHSPGKQEKHHIDTKIGPKNDNNNNNNTKNNNSAGSVSLTSEQQALLDKFRKTTGTDLESIRGKLEKKTITYSEEQWDELKNIFLEYINDEYGPTIGEGGRNNGDSEVEIYNAIKNNFSKVWVVIKQGYEMHARMQRMQNEWTMLSPEYKEYISRISKIESYTSRFWRLLQYYCSSPLNRLNHRWRKFRGGEGDAPPPPEWPEFEWSWDGGAMLIRAIGVGLQSAAFLNTGSQLRSSFEESKKVFQEKISEYDKLRQETKNTLEFIDPQIIQGLSKEQINLYQMKDELLTKLQMLNKQNGGITAFEQSLISEEHEAYLDKIIEKDFVGSFLDSRIPEELAFELYQVHYASREGDPIKERLEEINNKIAAVISENNWNQISKVRLDSISKNPLASFNSETCFIPPYVEKPEFKNERMSILTKYRARAEDFEKDIDKGITNRIPSYTKWAEIRDSYEDLVIKKDELLCPRVTNKNRFLDIAGQIDQNKLAINTALVYGLNMNTIGVYGSEEDKDIIDRLESRSSSLMHELGGLISAKYQHEFDAKELASASLSQDKQRLEQLFVHNTLIKQRERLVSKTIYDFFKSMVGNIKNIQLLQKYADENIAIDIANRKKILEQQIKEMVPQIEKTAAYFSQKAKSIERSIDPDNSNNKENNVSYQKLYIDAYNNKKKDFEASLENKYTFVNGILSPKSFESLDDGDIVKLKGILDSISDTFISGRDRYSLSPLSQECMVQFINNQLENNSMLEEVCSTFPEENMLLGISTSTGVNNNLENIPKAMGVFKAEVEIISMLKAALENTANQRNLLKNIKGEQRFQPMLREISTDLGIMEGIKLEQAMYYNDLEKISDPKNQPKGINIDYMSASEKSKISATEIGQYANNMATQAGQIQVLNTFIKQDATNIENLLKKHKIVPHEQTNILGEINKLMMMQVQNFNKIDTAIAETAKITKSLTITTDNMMNMMALVDKVWYLRNLGPIMPNKEELNTPSMTDDAYTTYKSALLFYGASSLFTLISSGFSHYWQLMSNICISGIQVVSKFTVLWDLYLHNLFGAPSPGMKDMAFGSTNPGLQGYANIIENIGKVGLGQTGQQLGGFGSTQLGVLTGIIGVDVISNFVASGWTLCKEWVAWRGWTKSNSETNLVKESLDKIIENASGGDILNNVKNAFDKVTLRFAQFEASQGIPDEMNDKDFDRGFKKGILESKVLRNTSLIKLMLEKESSHWLGNELTRDRYFNENDIEYRKKMEEIIKKGRLRPREGLTKEEFITHLLRQRKKSYLLRVDEWKKKVFDPLFETPIKYYIENLNNDINESISYIEEEISITNGGNGLKIKTNPALLDELFRWEEDFRRIFEVYNTDKDFHHRILFEIVLFIQDVTNKIGAFTMARERITGEGESYKMVDKSVLEYQNNILTNLYIYILVVLLERYEQIIIGINVLSPIINEESSYISNTYKIKTHEANEANKKITHLIKEKIRSSNNKIQKQYLDSLVGNEDETDELEKLSNTINGNIGEEKKNLTIFAPNTYPNQRDIVMYKTNLKKFLATCGFVINDLKGLENPVSPPPSFNEEEKRNFFQITSLYSTFVTVKNEVNKKWEENYRTTNNAGYLPTNMRTAFATWLGDPKEKGTSDQFLAISDLINDPDVRTFFKVFPDNDIFNPENYSRQEKGEWMNQTKVEWGRTILRAISGDVTVFRDYPDNWWVRMLFSAMRIVQIIVSAMLGIIPSDPTSLGLFILSKIILYLFVVSLKGIYGLITRSVQGHTGRIVKNVVCIERFIKEISRFYNGTLHEEGQWDISVIPTEKNKNSKQPSIELTHLIEKLRPIDEIGATLLEQIDWEWKKMAVFRSLLDPIVYDLAIPVVEHSLSAQVFSMVLSGRNNEKGTKFKGSPPKGIPPPREIDKLSMMTFLFNENTAWQMSWNRMAGMGVARSSEGLYDTTYIRKLLRLHRERWREMYPNLSRNGLKGVTPVPEEVLDHLLEWGRARSYIWNRKTLSLGVFSSVSGLNLLEGIEVTNTNGTKSEQQIMVKKMWEKIAKSMEEAMTQMKPKDVSFLPKILETTPPDEDYACLEYIQNLAKRNIKKGTKRERSFDDTNTIIADDSEYGKTYLGYLERALNDLYIKKRNKQIITGEVEQQIFYEFDTQTAFLFSQLFSIDININTQIAWRAIMIHCIILAQYIKTDIYHGGTDSKQKSLFNTGAFQLKIKFYQESKKRNTSIPNSDIKNPQNPFITLNFTEISNPQSLLQLGILRSCTYNCTEYASFIHQFSQDLLTFKNVIRSTLNQRISQKNVFCDINFFPNEWYDSYMGVNSAGIKDHNNSYFHKSFQFHKYKQEIKKETSPNNSLVEFRETKKETSPNKSLVDLRAKFKKTIQQSWPRPFADPSLVFTKFNRIYPNESIIPVMDSSMGKIMDDLITSIQSFFDCVRDWFLFIYKIDNNTKLPFLTPPPPPIYHPQRGW